MCLLCLRNLKQRLRNKVTDLLKSLGHMVELSTLHMSFRTFVEKKVSMKWLLVYSSTQCNNKRKNRTNKYD